MLGYFFYTGVLGLTLLLIAEAYNYAVQYRTQKKAIKR